MGGAVWDGRGVGDGRGSIEDGRGVGDGRGSRG